MQTSKQVAQIREQLIQALIQRDDAQKALDAANERIAALRNVLSGVVLGQSLQKEIDATQEQE